MMPAYEPETQAAIDEADAARKAYNEIETRIRDFDSQIRFVSYIFRLKNRNFFAGKPTRSRRKISARISPGLR